jgi:molecular chaperone Hsp33
MTRSLENNNNLEEINSPEDAKSPEQEGHQDFVIPFTLNDKVANGKYIFLSSSISQILNRHNYPIAISTIVAELSVVAGMLGSNLKDEGGIVTVELRIESGSLQFAMAECTYDGHIRGYAKYDEKIEENQNYDFSSLVGKGYIVITMDSATNNRYQGIVEVNKSGIAASISDYFSQSQQLDAHFNLRVSKNYPYNSSNEKAGWKATGLMITKLPAEGENESEFAAYKNYLDSLESEELLLEDNSSYRLLHKLFHENGVIIYNSRSRIFKCRCSREAMEQALSTIPKDELEASKVDGKIEIKCDFCGRLEYFE